MAFDTGITYSGPLADQDVGTPNQGNSMYLQHAALASLPSAGNDGVLLYATDGKVLLYDDGADLKDIIPTRFAFARKTSNEERTPAGTTLTNDADLEWDMKSGEVWEFKIVVEYYSDGTGVDIKLNVTNVTRWYAIGPQTGATDLSNTSLNMQPGSSGISFGALANPANSVVVIHGIAAPGSDVTAHLQWAAVSSGNLATAIGSYLIARRVA